MHDGVVLPDAIADDTWHVNLKGLWNLLDVAQRSETVERVVHVGERPRLLHDIVLCFARAVLRSEPSPPSAAGAGAAVDHARTQKKLTVWPATRRLMLDGVAWLHVPPRSRLRRLRRGRAAPRR